MPRSICYPQNVVVQVSRIIMYGKLTGNAVKCRKWIIVVVMVVVTDLEEKYGIVEMSAFFFLSLVYL